MEWILSNPRKVGPDSLSIFGNFEVDDTVYQSSACLESIRCIEQDLVREDPISRNIRCCLGASQFIQKDLLNILYCDNEIGELFSAAIRLLVNLTLPVECLFHIETVLNTPNGRTKIQQLEEILLDSKKAFLDVKSTAAVIKVIRDVLQKEYRDVPIKPEECALLSSCLLLLRNILHVPERIDSTLLESNDEKFADLQLTQNKLIWNLILQGLDSVLLLLISSNYREHWIRVLVELIGLIYKDQTISKLEQLLTRASSSSDSSEDDIESDFSKYSSTGNSDSSKLSLPASDSGCPHSPDKWSSQTSTRESSGSDTSGAKQAPGERHEADQQDSPQDQSDQSPFSDGERSPTKAKAFFSLHQSEEPVPQTSYETSSGCSNERTSSSDEDNREVIKLMTLQNAEHWRDVHTKISVKHRHPHLHVAAPSGSDFSNDEESDYLSSKQRNHPPKSRKIKNSTCCTLKGGKIDLCLRLDASDANKGRFCGKGHLWQLKKKSHLMLADTIARNPTIDDISNLLRDFTLNFLHHGLETLFTDLKKMFILQNSAGLDKCHFLWFLHYFLHLANTVQMSLHQLSSCVLSTEVIGYLTFEGVVTCEELQLAFTSQKRENSRPVLKRMHLLVKALRELISTIEGLTKKPVQKRDKTLLQKLHVQVAEMSDLRQLPLLLMRSYNPLIHQKQFLVDLVVVNHLLLLLLERAKTEEQFHGHFDVFTHLKQFATPKVMEVYGHVLKDFKTNGEFVNECVFTMMHHVAGDLGSPETLFQSHILGTFGIIMQGDWDVKEYWEDLMGYVMNRFVRTSDRTTEPYFKRVFGWVSGESDQSSEDEVEELALEAGSITSSSLAQSNPDSIDNQDLSDMINGDDDSLYWWYLHYEQDEDTVGRLVEYFAENNITYSREEVLNQLQCRGIINQNEYTTLKKKELQNCCPSECTMGDGEISLEGREKEDAANQEHHSNFTHRNDIKELLDSITEAGYKDQITWIQALLLEACYIKIATTCDEWTKKNRVKEPIPFHAISLNQSIPIVPFSEVQEESLKNEHFIQLLHKLGFHLPADVGRLYPRIPCFWMADVLYTVAESLGPIDREMLKFDIKDVQSLLCDQMITPPDSRRPSSAEASIVTTLEMSELHLEDPIIPRIQSSSSTSTQENLNEDNSTPDVPPSTAVKSTNTDDVFYLEMPHLIKQLAETQTVHISS